MGKPRLNETPEQREQRVREEQKKATFERDRRKQRAKLGGEMMRELKLRILHLPREEGFAGATVVYRYADMTAYKPRSIVEVAVALQHPNDPYIKSEGRFYAADRFDEGHSIAMRVNPNAPTVEAFLAAVFGGC